jgi:hypothetical protein
LIIHRLAVSLDAVEFEPHMTVYCGPSTEAEARAVAEMIAKQFSLIELTCVICAVSRIRCRTTDV